MATSPMQLSLQKIREEGYKVLQITEYWNPFARRRIDLFGFIDILAIKDGHVLAIQTTTVGNMGARVKKIGNNDNVGEVRNAEWTIHVHGWHKPNGLWECIVKDVS